MIYLRCQETGLIILLMLVDYETKEDMSLVEMEQLEKRERHSEVFTTGVTNDKNKKN